jgi:hypothetical protein
MSNLHLVGRVKDGASASIVLHNGSILEVGGLERIQFDDKAARKLFPGKSEAFLTCRNFQFAAQHFGKREKALHGDVAITFEQRRQNDVRTEI